MLKPTMYQRAIEGAMDQGSIERATDGANNGSESNTRSDGCCKRLIRERSCQLHGFNLS